MADFVIKKDNTSPAIERQLTDENGNALDVSSAGDIRFVMGQVPGETPKVGDNLAGNVSMPNGGGDGVVKYEWQTGDTDTAGRFKAEFEVEWQDGTIEDFPIGYHLIILVRQDVG